MSERTVLVSLCLEVPELYQVESARVAHGEREPIERALCTTVQFSQRSTDLCIRYITRCHCHCHSIHDSKGKKTHYNAINDQNYQAIQQ